MNATESTSQNETETFTVSMSGHDCGGPDGKMVRSPLARAEWTANLMRQCGYTVVTITKN